jgi:hypothetical protein
MVGPAARLRVHVDAAEGLHVHLLDVEVAAAVRT